MFTQVAFAETSVLNNSPNLAYERDLLHKHDILAQHYNQNYKQIIKPRQPANKTEKCLIVSDLLDGLVDNNSLIFWEGSCELEYAEGFGRLYVVSGGKRTFEMLANFHSDDPNYTTTYYSKNTSVSGQTVYFYGKSNRFKSSGITITESIDKDLIVKMQAIDKINLVTYQKETSYKSHYILNIKDMGNYSHFIHDLRNTPYRSISMSYKLEDASIGSPLGYTFLGLKNHKLQGEYINEQKVKSKSNIPVDVIQHVIEINEEIETAIEDSIKNVIESLPVIDAYLRVICDKNYNTPVCRKMQCKLICDPEKIVSPDDAAVKEMLLRLVEHHNARPTKVYLDKLISDYRLKAQS